MDANDVGTLEQLWAKKLKQLHGLAISINTERERGNEAGVQALRTVFVAVVADLNAIAERIRVNESSLDWVERFLVSVDEGARAVIQMPKGIIDLSGLKPLLYIGLALYALTALGPVLRTIEHKYTRGDE